MKMETMSWKKTEGEDAARLPGVSLSKARNPQNGCSEANRVPSVDHGSSRVCVCLFVCVRQLVLL